MNHNVLRYNKHKQVTAGLAVLAVVLTGTVTFLLSHAATPYASITADKGVLTNHATIDNSCSGAIDGSCVVFGSISSGSSGGTGTTSYTLPPATQTNGDIDQWYWEISPPSAGLGGLPATTGAYPTAGAANIWDTDLFQDAGSSVTSAGSYGAGIPTGASPVVEAIHAAGHYSVCYVEAGAQQTGFSDFIDFASADYLNGSISTTTQMQGYAGENWFNIAGFAKYVAGQPATLTGAAPNIAAGLDARFKGCKAEGQDAVEPDDLDGYTNKSQSKAAGGGWDLTQADSAGFERWLAYDIHFNDLAVFQKNDPANEPADAALFDGMIIEECNFYDDPCAGSGGDATAYLADHKPVLNAEYEDTDKETTAKFCSADDKAGISGSLFDVDLDSKFYEPCPQTVQLSGT
jgi:hypothetical protein